MEYILRFALLTLLYVPEATLLDIQPLLTDKEMRARVLSYAKDSSIISFWQNEFDQMSPKLRAEAISPILNKTGLFITSVPLRNIVGQKTSSFRLQQVLDTGKILIVNLSKGQIGEDASSLLGAMLINSIQLAALHRAIIPEKDRKPFYLYIDECHSFVTLSFTTILSEARKYGLSLFLAHQYIEQMEEKIRAAIFGNVGTMISFRVGAVDAEYLEKEFYPIFSKTDFVNLPRYALYLKLMINGTTSQPFSAKSLEKRSANRTF
jgi:type IV secretory pathway TraG/TraD family ATPase VirD4